MKNFILFSALCVILSQARNSQSNLQLQPKVLDLSDADSVAVIRRGNLQNYPLFDLQSNVVSVNDADFVNRNSRRRNLQNYAQSNSQGIEVDGLDNYNSQRLLDNYENLRRQSGRRSQNSRCGKPLFCMCPPSYPPICGDDGNTYYGACQFNCGLQLNSTLRILGDIPCLIGKDLSNVNNP